MAGQGITKLEVVNRMLLAIGQSHPESSLDSSGTWPALTYDSGRKGRMEELLDDVSRREQRKGFRDNVVPFYRFTSSAGGEVDLSAVSGFEQTLKVEATGSTWNRPMALRGTKILDIFNNSVATWGNAQPVDAKVWLWIDFDDLDPGTAEYIAAEAIREAQRRYRGDKQVDMELGEESTEAMADADRPVDVPSPAPAPLGMPTIPSANQGR